MSEELKKGDVVELKSGGPEMTIDGFTNSGTTSAKCNCQWFVSFKLRRGCFSKESLKIATK